MPVFELETPQGTFEVEAPDINTALKAVGGSAPNESMSDASTPPVEAVEPYADRAGREADALEGMGLKRLPGSAFMDGIVNGATFGFADEISSAINAPFRAVRDQTGVGEAYTREKALQREQKGRQRDAAPVQSIAGDIAGGLATGGALMKGGLTLAGKNLPVVGRTGAAMAEGAGYGAAYGAGNADGDDLGRSALTGAAFGAAAGGALEKGGRAVQKLMQPKQAAPIGSQSLRQQEGSLFEKARSSGVSVTPQGVDRLADNLTLAAGRINQNLRPQTAGMLDDVLAMKGRGADVQTVHELRQSIQSAMKNADDQDVKALTKMLKIVDAFIDKPNPKFVSGGKEGFKTLREAIDTSAKRFKTERIEKLLDFADVKTGQYSQSGMVNALRSEANSLYKQIINGRVKGFTPEEISIIRSLAKTENSTAATKLLSRLAPRGPVSMMAGTITGGFLGGPIGAAIPATAGAMAARSADKAALNAARTLQRSVSTGGKVLPQLPFKSTNARLIGGANAGMTNLPQR